MDLKDLSKKLPVNIATNGNWISYDGTSNTGLYIGDESDFSIIGSRSDSASILSVTM